MTEVKDRSVYVTGEDVYQWMVAAQRILTSEAQAVNQLNVFPVPDGDTGNNMLGTVQEAVRHMQHEKVKTTSQAWRVVADGALVGARGNSGMILSQLLKGFAETQARTEFWTAQDLARAFVRAYEVAFRQVHHPVEGTILSVARRMAEAAKGDTVADILQAVSGEGRLAVRDTTEQLPQLRKAGVVDAGAQGYWLLVEAWRQAHLGGQTLLNPVDTTSLSAPNPHDISLEAISFPFDTEAMIENWGKRHSLVDAVALLEEIGDSIVVAEAGTAVKVHVHTDRPQALMELLFSFGDVVQMEMLDMRHQAGQMQTHSELEKNRELTVVAPSAYHPLFEGVETVVPERGLDQIDVLWVAPERPLAHAYPVPTVAIAGQLVLEYDPFEEWASNRSRFDAVSTTMNSIVVDRRETGYVIDGQLFDSRDALLNALRSRLPLTGVTTIYLNLRARHEEAVFWQTKLRAELVQLPAEGVWMEVIEQP